MYGTLGLDDVVRALIDRVPVSTDTSAPGWRVARLPDLPYPGLVADPASEATGRVYCDLSEREWSVLDAFENPTYVVEPVDLRSGRRGLAYVWPGEPLSQTWTPSSLNEESMRAYLERCIAWRARHEGLRE